LVAATIAGRLAGRTRHGPAIVVAGGFATVPLTLFLLVPRPENGAWRMDVSLWSALVAGTLFSILLWWRGVRLAPADHHEETSRTFPVGALALACLAFVFHMHGQAVARQGTAYVIWIVFLLIAIGAGLIMVTFALLLRVEGLSFASGGEVVIACCLALLTETQSALPAPETLGPPILLFLCAGLVMRALVGVSWILNNQRGRGGTRLRVDRNWLAVVGGSVLGVVSLGLLVGEWITPGAVASAMRWLRPVWSLVTMALAFVVLSVMWVALSLARRLFPNLRLRLPELPSFLTDDLEGLGERSLNLPPFLKRGTNVALILIAVVVVAWILYRAVRRLRWERSSGIDAREARKTVLSWDLLRAQLRAALAGLLRREPSPFVGLGLPGSTRRVVRRAYQRVLGRAILLGVPREAAQTPAAYVETLLDLCPGERRALETLTAAYEVARYGALPPTQEQARAAQEAFARIDPLLQAQVRRARQAAASAVETDT